MKASTNHTAILDEKKSAGQVSRDMAIDRSLQLESVKAVALALYVGLNAVTAQIIIRFR